MDLEQVLATLRKYGVSSAEVPGEGGQVLRVVFETAQMPLPGEVPTPGAWKSPARLDAPEQFDP